MYFKVSPDIKPVFGRDKLLFHSLIDGKTFYFDHPYMEIISDLLEGMSLEKVKEKYDNNIVNELEKYLFENKLGINVDNDLYKLFTIHKYYNSELQDKMSKFFINSLMLRITSSCNLNCSFCRKDEHILSGPCMCHRFGSSLEANDIIDIFQFVYPLGIKQIKLIGGEPFSQKSTIKALLKHLSTLGITVQIYTNALLINEEDLSYIKASNAEIIIRRFYFPSLIEYDAFYTSNIVGYNNYDEKIQHIISMFEENSIKYAIDIVVEKYDSEINRIINNGSSKLNSVICLFESEFKFPSTDTIAIKGFKKNNTKVTLQNYEDLERYNPCFRDGVFIDTDKKVFPCIGLSFEKYLLENNPQNINSIFKEKKHLPYWMTSNSNNSFCSSCSDRLRCVSCRAYSIVNEKANLQCDLLS